MEMAKSLPPNCKSIWSLRTAQSTEPKPRVSSNPMIPIMMASWICMSWLVSWTSSNACWINHIIPFNFVRMF
ncbi:uncharacterized protein DEA37_0002484 [Paragonimus westermani]|uniref:Uncharacterized protein n=1 Tax=Paragonimus westermani TaxID=34504 RepID=A0A5J4NKS1_9TREM|nr:uncharacterized protein DEA37_0002484 [Paragonimus westermani]